MVFHVILEKAGEAKCNKDSDGVLGFFLEISISNFMGISPVIPECFR